MSAADLMGLAGAPPPGAPPSIQVQGEPPPGAAPGPAGAPLSPDQGMGGLPPELAGLLAGGGPEEAGGGELPESEIDTLDQIREMCLHYMDIASDDIEKSEMAKILQGVQKLLAKNQQEGEAATGTTPAMKGMRKAIEGRA